MAGAVAGVERGCGFRQAGGIYWETGLVEKDGAPVEHFLVDPPVPVDADALGLTPVGVKLIQHEGVWHVMDWVGQEGYPNVADMVEEVRRFGVSRRLPATLDFRKVTAASRIILVHTRAYINNARPWLRAKGFSGCPKGLAEHVIGKTSTPAMCAGVWWDDLDEGAKPIQKGHQGRAVQRSMPSFAYKGKRRPREVVPEYRVAIFARFPLSRLVVVQDEVGGQHEEAVKRLTGARHIPEIVDR